MRRATRSLALALLAATLSTSPAGAAAQLVNSINGIGLIDYSRKPDFKVGSWAKYHVTGHSELGAKDDYFVTILIAGEERWWGEDCLWIETWTEREGKPSDAVATCMSFAIFDDSLAIPHLQVYQRKLINGFRQDGQLDVQITRRALSNMKTRTPLEDQINWKVDTLGTDTVTVVRGTYDCTKVRMEQAAFRTFDAGDSSTYNEVREIRQSFYSPRVPLTSIVREDIDYTMLRKTWLVGQSQNAASRIRDHSIGTAELVDFGEGLTPRLVPAQFPHDPARATRGGGGETGVGTEDDPREGGHREAGRGEPGAGQAAPGDPRRALTRRVTRTARARTPRDRTAPSRRGPHPTPPG